MKEMLTQLVVLLAVMLCSAYAFSAAAPDVRELMSAEEFEEAGLDKLVPSEIDALNRWLLRFTAREAPVLRQSSEAVREEVRKAEDNVIDTTIEGEFHGWTGNTVFRLKNGQVWEQRMKGSWRYHAVEPRVQIRKNFLGFWEMVVVDANRQIGVRRIQ